MYNFEMKTSKPVQPLLSSTLVTTSPRFLFRSFLSRAYLGASPFRAFARVLPLLPLCARSYSTNRRYYLIACGHPLLWTFVPTDTLLPLQLRAIRRPARILGSTCDRDGVAALLALALSLSAFSQSLDTRYLCEYAAPPTLSYVDAEGPLSHSTDYAQRSSCRGLSIMNTSLCRRQSPSSFLHLVLLLRIYPSCALP